MSARFLNEKLKYLDDCDALEIYIRTCICILMRVKALYLTRATISALSAMQYLSAASNIFSRNILEAY